MADQRVRTTRVLGIPCPWDGDDIYTAPALQLAGGHRIVSQDPLTIEPSILCPDCGLHGWIRDGQWTT